MEENNHIFRKQSLAGVSSSEQLNDYIRSAEPGVWAVLIAIILVMLGVCVWGVFGRLDTTLTVGAVSSGGELFMYISEADKNRIENGMPVSVNGHNCIISGISESPVRIGDEDDAYAVHVSALEKGDFAYAATAQTDIPDGSYKAVITIDSVSPMSFITN